MNRKKISEICQILVILDEFLKQNIKNSFLKGWKQLKLSCKLNKKQFSHVSNSNSFSTAQQLMKQAKTYRGNNLNGGLNQKMINFKQSGQQKTLLQNNKSGFDEQDTQFEDMVLDKIMYLEKTLSSLKSKTNSINNSFCNSDTKIENIQSKFGNRNVQSIQKNKVRTMDTLIWQHPNDEVEDQSQQADTTKGFFIQDQVKFDRIPLTQRKYLYYKPKPKQGIKNEYDENERLSVNWGNRKRKHERNRQVEIQQLLKYIEENKSQYYESVGQSSIRENIDNSNNRNSEESNNILNQIQNYSFSLSNSNKLNGCLSNRSVVPCQKGESSKAFSKKINKRFYV